MSKESPNYLLLGRLRRETIITAQEKTLLDHPGGNLLYSAGGAGIWLAEDEVAGLVARVGEDYPRQWIEDFAGRGFNVSGIRIQPEMMDVRQFIAYTDLETRHTDDPVSHFARLEQPFPRALLGYKDPYARLDSQKDLLPISIRQTDLPESYRYANAAHIAPIDYLTHSLLPAVLRQAGLTTVTLDPGPNYMHSKFWDLVPALLPGLTAFLPSEEDVRELFRGSTEDLWEMAEALAGYGCELVVIKCGGRGQLLYETASKTRYEIPAYPARLVDLTGVGDAFAGGFLVGYRQTFEPLQAVLYGNVSASLAVEGSGPFFPMEALPGLQQARLESLVDVVRKV